MKERGQCGVTLKKIKSRSDAGLFNSCRWMIVRRSGSESIPTHILVAGSRLDRGELLDVKLVDGVGSGGDTTGDYYTELRQVFNINLDKGLTVLGRWLGFLSTGGLDCARLYGWANLCREADEGVGSVIYRSLKS
jgi:hypothetical protein